MILLVIQIRGAQNQSVSATTWVNPGARIHDVVERIPDMLHIKSASVALHLALIISWTQGKVHHTLLKHLISFWTKQRRISVKENCLYVMSLQYTNTETQKLNTYLKHKCERKGFMFVDSKLTSEAISRDRVH